MTPQQPLEASPDEYPPKANLDEDGKYYKKLYRINAVGKDGLTTTVAIPREIIKRAAEKKKMLPKKFIKSHHAVVIYNSFDGVFIRFVKKDKRKEDIAKEKK